MSNQADHFRMRAKQCRQLAEDARNEESRRTLIEMADDLEAEARLIDGDEPKPD